jgi:predicted acyltransferase (DUF342 family)
VRGRSFFARGLKGMSSPSDLGVVPVRDENGNVVSYTVGRQSAPEHASASDQGWVASARSFETGTVPQPSASDALKAYMRARIKARRRLAEEDGVVVEGIVYDTSDDAHLRLMTLLVFASRDPEYVASILIRDGSVRQLTSPEIYRVAIAIANHMQACALWEIASLQAVEDATTTEDLLAFETTIDDGAPSGDVTEPSPPNGTQPPPAYDDAVFKAITCDSIGVLQNASVAGDLAVTGNSVVTGNATVNGTLTTTAATILESTLSVTGNSSIDGTLTVASGTSLQSTLAVANTTLLTGELTVVSPTMLQSSLSVVGNTDITGTLTTVDATTLQSTLKVDGSTTLVGELTAQAAAVLQSSLSVAGNSTLSGTLTTVGATELQSTLAVTGGSTFNADVAVQNANVNVTGSINVSEDAVVERLYARDKLGMGTMSINTTARARTESWIVAGSFWWRRGDRQPTGATVSFTITDSQSKPAVVFFELERRQILGYAVVPSNGATVATLSMQDTLFTPNDDTAFQVEVYISNATEKGVVTLANYFISAA